jgi:hypothetical protein
MTSDDELRAMLRSLDARDGDSQLGAEHGEALRDRIMSSAKWTLAARQRRTVWDYSAQWARAAVPVALAASILAALVLIRAPEMPTEGGETTVAYDATDDAQTAVRNAAYGQVGSAEMLDSLVGPATRDALYTRVLRGVQ